MLWILFAAAPPQPIALPRASLDPRALFTADDYPAEALRRHESGTVIARLVIDPLGKVESCSIGYSSKSESLDHATCQILQRRARFKPAQDDSGTAVYTVMLTPPITWFSTDNIPATSVKVRPDAEIELAKAPPGIYLPTDLTVSYVVSAQGQITSCGDSAPSVNADLVAVACDPANLPKPMPMKSAAGNAVDVLYNWNVRFTLGTQ